MTEEKFTLFFRGPFSQWHRDSDHWFEVAGVTYNCAEQYMMAEKARLFGDEGAEKQIMSAGHPRDQKAIGKLVKPFDEDRWNLAARDIVYKGNYAKFTQHADLKDELLETAGTTLVEASPYDHIWGIKLGSINPDCHDRSKWRGTNWLGEVLTKVRDDLMAGVETTEDFGWRRPTSGVKTSDPNPNPKPWTEEDTEKAQPVPMPSPPKPKED